MPCALHKQMGWMWHRAQLQMLTLTTTHSYNFTIAKKKKKKKKKTAWSSVRPIKRYYTACKLLWNDIIISMVISQNVNLQHTAHLPQFHEICLRVWFLHIAWPLTEDQRSFLLPRFDPQTSQFLNWQVECSLVTEPPSGLIDRIIGSFTGPVYHELRAQGLSTSIYLSFQIDTICNFQTKTGASWVLRLISQSLSTRSICSVLTTPMTYQRDLQICFCFWKWPPPFEIYCNW